jgi:hypothetical protein
MAFVSWRTEYNRAKEALANKTWNEYFLSSVENRQEMRTTYTILGNITDFVDWLRTKAQEEESEFGEGGIPMCIGGY